MASTELSLQRSLSDSMEDQIYDYNPDQSVFYPQYFAQVQTKGIYESLRQQVINSNSNEFVGCGMSTGGSYPTSKMFSKYGDPTLTTTTFPGLNNDVSNENVAGDDRGEEYHSESRNDVQETISLRKVMKDPKQSSVYTTTMQYDIKITDDRDDHDELDSFYVSHSYDDFEEVYNEKLDRPLQDDSMALSHGDAKEIFDDEYDDDLSDDDDNDNTYFETTNAVPPPEPATATTPTTEVATETQIEPTNLTEVVKRKTDTKKPVVTNGHEIFQCTIMNLVTNQPCSAQFSRSYDLTRHQNTIHAKRKIVFRCSECIRSLGSGGLQKTFSRLDALSRHIKSKHENLSSEERHQVTQYAKQNIAYAAA